MDKPDAREVLETLSKISSSQIEWKDFLSIYHWESKPLFGSDTYPGAFELYSFLIEITSCTVEITAYIITPGDVVCVVAKPIRYPRPMSYLDVR